MVRIATEGRRVAAEGAAVEAPTIGARTVALVSMVKFLRLLKIHPVEGRKKMRIAAENVSRNRIPKIIGWQEGKGGCKSIDLHLNMVFGPFLVCTRPPPFSSHVQTHNWVLVYKPNKDSCLFSMWDNTFSFEKLLFTTYNTWKITRRR